MFDRLRGKVNRHKLAQVFVACALIAMVLLTPLQALRAASGSQTQAAKQPPPATTQTARSGGGETPAPSADGPMRETRAVWVSRWDFAEHSDVQQIVDNASRAHMNVIFFQVRGQADALYKSSLEPWAADLSGTLGKDPGYDPLADLITAAHAKGIEVHAWMNTYPVWMGDTPPSASVSPTPMYDDFNQRYGNDWVEWNGTQPMQLGGDGYIFANPAHPAVQDHIVDVCKDLLSHYDLDGLHLDYIRYSGREISQDPVSNKAYADAAAQNPGLTREDWQRDQVTHLVQRIHDEALPLRPGAKLSTTAWPVYQDRWGWYKGNDGYSAFYQDSQRWAREGTVSAIVPMLYGMTLNGHLDRYQTLAQDYVQGSQPGGVVLGITADTDSFSDLTDRINVARQLGANGESFFSYRALDAHNYWAALGDGPYHQPAFTTSVISPVGFGYLTWSKGLAIMPRLLRERSRLPRQEDRATE